MTGILKRIFGAGQPAMDEDRPHDIRLVFALGNPGKESASGR